VRRRSPKAQSSKLKVQGKFKVSSPNAVWPPNQPFCANVCLTGSRGTIDWWSLGLNGSLPRRFLVLGNAKFFMSFGL